MRRVESVNVRRCVLCVVVHLLAFCCLSDQVAAAPHASLEALNAAGVRFSIIDGKIIATKVPAGKKVGAEVGDAVVSVHIDRRAHGVSGLDMSEGLDVVAAGQRDEVIVPLFYDTDSKSKSSGKEISGFVRIQYLEPERVDFERGTVDAEAVAAEVDVSADGEVRADEYDTYFPAGPLGLELDAQKSDTVSVLAVVPGGQAHKAGVEVGDTLVAVGDESVEGLSFRQATQKVAEMGYPMELRFRKAQTGAEERAKAASIEAEPKGDLVVTEPTLFGGLVIPYLRAEFGTIPGCEPFNVTIAEPAMACQALADEKYAGSYVVSLRGQCTFEEKASHVIKAGGTGLIVVSAANQEVVRMPGHPSGALETNIPAIMVSSAMGTSLQKGAAFGLITVKRNDGKCATLDVASLTPRMSVQGGKRTRAKKQKGQGVLVLWDGGDNEHVFEYVAAAFGPPVRDVPVSRVVLAHPDNGCVSSTLLFRNRNDLIGSIVAFKRGVCAFPDKVRAAQKAGAVGVIVINNAESIIPMMAPEAQSDLRIPAVMVKQSFVELMASGREDVHPLGRIVDVPEA